MPDSQIQKSNSPNNRFSSLTCIDLLCLVDTARKALLPSCDPGDEWAKIATSLIEQAAEEADRAGLPFTEAFAIEFIERIRPRRAISKQARLLISEVEDIQELGNHVGLLKSLFQRINTLTGIPIHELQQTIVRLAARKPLDLKYGETESSLNHVAAKLHELDAAGTSKSLWRTAWQRSSILREAVRSRGTNCKLQASEPSEPPSEDTSISAQEKAIVAARKKKFAEYIDELRAQGMRKLLQKLWGDGSQPHIKIRDVRGGITDEAWKKTIWRWNQKLYEAQWPLFISQSGDHIFLDGKLTATN